MIPLGASRGQPRDLKFGHNLKLGGRINCALSSEKGAQGPLTPVVSLNDILPLQLPQISRCLF